MGPYKSLWVPKILFLAIFSLCIRADFRFWVIFISNIATRRYPPEGRFLPQKTIFGQISKTPAPTRLCGHPCGRRVAPTQVQSVFFQCLGSPVPPGGWVAARRSARNSSILAFWEENAFFVILTGLRASRGAVNAMSYC